MTKNSGIFIRILAYFGLFAVGLALAMGITGYFAASNLSLELLAKRSDIILDTLIQAEKQTRNGDEIQFEAHKLVSAFNLDFRVGKQLPTPWALLDDGLHVLEGGDHFVFIKHLDNIPYALGGSINLKNTLLRTICSMFLFCGLIGLMAAIILSVFLADRLARPIQSLASSLKAESGQMLPIHTALTGRHDEIGTLARSIKTYQESAIEYIEREKSFTTAASHELRTPLAIILNGLELLENISPDKNQSLAIIERLKRTINNMNMTVGALLCLARGEKLPLIKINVKRIISNVLQDLAPARSPGSVNTMEVLTKKIHMGNKTNIITSGDITEVWGEEHLAATVLRNLLENAFRHSNGCDIFLDVTDNTIQIRNMARFMPQSPDGSGFGLLIAQRACNRMGWRLLQSGNDRETRFRIEFPPSGNDK